jgi:hypothetical protein
MIRSTCDGSDEADGAHEVFDIAIEAGCDALPAFDPILTLPLRCDDGFA